MRRPTPFPLAAIARWALVVSGMTLEQFFYERIFRPLSMKDTHFHLPAADEPRLAAVYQPRADKTIERVPEGRQDQGATTFPVT